MNLTTEQAEALQAFAQKYGRCWKQTLMEAWLSGRDVGEPNGHLLRQIRNNLGPSWLTKYKGGNHA